MNKRQQEVSILALLFITSGILGFFLVSFLNLESFYLVISISCLLSISFMAISYGGYRFSNILHQKKRFSKSLELGNYRSILDEINNHDGMLRTCWEYQLLALYHSGQLEAFEKLYDTYMNEINDCATFERYQLYIFHGLIQLMYDKRLPIRMISRKDIAHYGYAKTSKFEQYRAILLGIQEYHKPQKSLSKVYFEKFLNQELHISKPLAFQLYYVISQLAVCSEHPQVTEYLHRVEACIYDKASYELYRNHLQVKKDELQKDMRGQNPMDKQQDKNRRASIQEMESRAQASKHQYNQPDQRNRFRTPSQRDDEMMQFSRSDRSSHDYQSDFDALNASVQDGSFNLYEEPSYPSSKPHDRFKDEYVPTSAHLDDFDSELDPTWFMRSAHRNEEVHQAEPVFEKPLYDDSPSDTSFAMRRRSNSYQQKRAPMQDMLEDTSSSSYTGRSSTVDDPFTSARPHDELPHQEEFNTMRRRQRTNIEQEQGSDYTNLRSNTRQQANNQQNPMMQPASMNITREEQQPRTNPRSFQQNDAQYSQPSRSINSRMNQAHEQNRFQRFEQMNQQQQDVQQTSQAAKLPQSFNRTQAEQLQQTIMPKKQENKKAKNKATNKMKINTQERAQTTISNKFIKTNLTILCLSLINGVVIAFACGSFIYVSFFNKYPIDDKIIPEIILSSLFIAVLMMYITAGIHTGYTIISKYVAAWNMTLKIVLSPLLLIACLLIGVICEIPYLIFNAIKNSNSQ